MIKLCVKNGSQDFKITQNIHILVLLVVSQCECLNVHIELTNYVWTLTFDTKMDNAHINIAVKN